MNQEELPGYYVLPEPELSFHPTRSGDRSVHPLRGLLQFGPYSRSLISHVLDPVRIALITPASVLPQVKRFFTEFEQLHKPLERRQYLPDFPGFQRIFGVRLLPPDDALVWQTPLQTDHALEFGDTATQTAADYFARALKQAASRRSDYDVLYVALPDRWSRAFEGSDGFDLHDFIKIAAAGFDIPCQVLREHSALTYRCRCSVMWRLSIATYCKAGGIPWRLANTEPDTAYIGLGFTLRKRADGSAEFLSCCSQTFDADGTGLEFLVYPTTDYHFVGENPFLNKVGMRRLLSRSVDLYCRRHAGRFPRKVVVHRSAEFRRDEIEGALEALTGVPEIELTQVQQDTSWRAINFTPAKVRGRRGQPSAFPCKRGSVIPIGPREVLLFTQGNAPEANDGKDFFKEARGIPRPILLRRYAGHGGWAESVRSALALTKMNWNSDSLYDRLPVTLEFASELAQVIRGMGYQQIRPTPHQVRFFI